MEHGRVRRGAGDDTPRESGRPTDDPFLTEPPERPTDEGRTLVPAAEGEADAERRDDADRQADAERQAGVGPRGNDDRPTQTGDAISPEPVEPFPQQGDETLRGPLNVELDGGQPGQRQT